MTLHKAIEAARNGLTIAEDFMKDKNVPSFGYQVVKQALSALPAKPMSEDEIATKIRDILIENVDDSSSVLNVVSYDIIRALRDAGVLYVEEKE